MQIGGGVERHMEDPLAEEILKGTIKEGDTVEVTAADGKRAFNVPEESTPANAS